MTTIVRPAAPAIHSVSVFIFDENSPPADAGPAPEASR